MKRILLLLVLAGVLWASASCGGVDDVSDVGAGSETVEEAPEDCGCPEGWW